MDTATLSDLHTVLILKADRIYAESLRAVVVDALAQPDVQLATSVAQAAAVVAENPTDLLIAGVDVAIDGNVLDFIASCLKKPRRARRVLALITDSEFRLLSALRSLPIQGVFDSANDEPGNFIPALRTVASGSRYWSPSVLERISNDIDYPDSLFRILTQFEQVVLAVVGDGSDDVAAARELNLSPSTISTVRRHLHRKLGVQHRGELMRVAAQNGFVRFTPAGVIRPGFAMLAASYQTRRKKGEDPPKNPAR